MPELPEVETVRRGLEKYVVGHMIEGIDILNPGIFEGDKNLIIGSSIRGVRRIGKGLILDLSNNYSLAIHIKLTGQLIYRGPETEGVEVDPEKVGTVPNKFTHVIFHLNDPRSKIEDQHPLLYYNDQRRFGWIRVVPTDKIPEMKFFKTMGPEPFKDLSLAVFEKIIEGKSTKIKPLIMDQVRIGGIGNIYANDALFKAKINPSRPAKSLNDQEIKDLYDSIIAVMEKSFKEGGASELSFVNVLGQTGNYQRYSLVYGKTGKPCPNCGAKITFAKLAGRGTYTCENCQK